MDVSSNAPLDYFDLQDSTDLVTRAEILRYVRSHDRSLSERRFTYYVDKGLIPPALRVGSKTGAYPAVVQELICWILDCRKRGLAIDAIKELLPLWKMLKKAQHRDIYDLAEIEYVARQHIHRTEANLEVPWLVSRMTFGQLCEDCRGSVTWVLKDGTETSALNEPLRLSFVMTELDKDDGFARPVAWTQLVIPGMEPLPEDDDPRTIWLGSPIGTPIRCMSESGDAGCTNSEPDHKELVPIG